MRIVIVRTVQDLVLKGDEITRCTVQKSVCVLSQIPLFGTLKTKLQVITRAYFAERDFTKVEVLSQLYTNLCDMFDDKTVDEQATNIELLEKGLRYCAAPMSYEMGSTKDDTNNCQSGNPDHGKHSTNTIFPSSSAVFVEKSILETDNYGFPLSIFINGNLFYPYVSLSYLDMIQSDLVRGFTIGATNALFVTKRDHIDVIVTIDDQNCGQIDFIDNNLKRELTLTSADLRFVDYVIKNIEENRRSNAGNDEWLRMQMQEYLLSMGASSRSDLTMAIADYGASFIHSWRTTQNYKIWMNGSHEDLSGITPGHAFSGQLGVYDVFLRMEHTMSGSESARKALSAITSTGKNIGMDIPIMHTDRQKATFESQSFYKFDVDDPLDQNGSKISTSGINTPEGEQIRSKTKGFSTWFRGEQRNKEDSKSDPNLVSSEEPI
ncbi:hypothetical protein DICVIV_07674 [Dictyocaulus viviparus]|uniref:AVL9/DENND6 domain-containing protein n=1 Tax=Dictyocaulus viviparus TaxID=29172 RepID=A0A0D8XVA6_DICVI|nr:hypothetical protein DICVIV_07674 [Dictyocaulus viviparus]